MSLTTAAAHAGYGAYIHGYGSQSEGLGGVGFAVAQDTTPLSANPALAIALGRRWDLGLHWANVDPSASITGNRLGRDAEYRSSKRNFFVPQFGFTRPLAERWAIGMTGFVAGFGAEYETSPYERFGGDPMASLNLGQAGLSSVLAYAIRPEQNLGFSLNLSYQDVKVEGFNAFARVSESPDRFTDQGRDGAFGAGFTLGWHGALAPWAQAGVAYRSKTWTQRADEYAGLLPDQGLLELPAIYGAGVALSLIPELIVAVEFQRVMYASEKAIGNGIEQLFEERQDLGSDDGAGFGWKNQNIYKLGLAWHANARTLLRAGYSYGTQIIPRSQTLFNALGPSLDQKHVTLGITLGVAPGWELTGAASKALRNSVRGENSIPGIAGGGEVDLNLRTYSVNISVGRYFRP